MNRSGWFAVLMGVIFMVGMLQSRGLESAIKSGVAVVCFVIAHVAFSLDRRLP